MQQHPRKQRAVAVQLAEVEETPAAAKQVAPERQTLTTRAPMSLLQALTALRVLVVKAVAVLVGQASRRVAKAVVADRASPKRVKVAHVDPMDPTDQVARASPMAVSPIFPTAVSRTSPVQVGMDPASRAGRISPVREAKAPVMAASTSPAFRVVMVAAVGSRVSRVAKKVKSRQTPVLMRQSMLATLPDTAARI